MRPHCRQADDVPSDVVRKWARRFKAADVDGLSALYEDDTAHHPVLTDPLHGLE